MTPAEHYRAAENLLDAATKQHNANIDKVNALCRGNDAAMTEMSAQVSTHTAVMVAAAQVHALLAAIPREDPR